MFITIVALVILSFLGINLRSIVESDIGRANFSYLREICLTAWNFILNLWQNHLQGPFLSLTANLGV